MISVRIVIEEYTMDIRSGLEINLTVDSERIMSPEDATIQAFAKESLHTYLNGKGTSSR